MKLTDSFIKKNTSKIPNVPISFPDGQGLALYHFPNERYYDVGKLPPGNGKVVVTFKDSDDGRSVFAPYRVTLYLTCEQ